MHIFIHTALVIANKFEAYLSDYKGLKSIFQYFPLL